MGDAWPVNGSMRAVTVDRSLLSMSETKVLPSERDVLEALSAQIAIEEVFHIYVCISHLYITYAPPLTNVYEGGP